MPNFLLATVIDHQQPASQFHQLRLKPTADFNFKSGQYISIKVAPARINKYSLANRPGEREFELIVDCTPGQIGSLFVEKLQVGDQIEYLGPLGIFILKTDDLSRELFFIATGSGIAPLKSMIEDLLINQRDTRPITLYFGLRYPKDVFLKTYFEQMAAQYGNFKFILTISKPDQEWTGLKGRVTEHLLSNLGPATDYSAYICGSGPMIADTEQLLISKGLPPERIYYEKFYD